MRSARAPALPAALLLLFVAPAARAQPASQPTSQPTSQPASQPVDDDLSDIQQALDADSKQITEKTAKTSDKLPVVSGLSRTFQSLNPDISFIADVAAAYYTTREGEDPLLSGGHDPKENGFNLQQLELYASGMVDPYFRFDANLVFSQFGVEIEEVYATTLSLPWNLQVRAGQFLTRFGRINNSHPHTWHFVDQMLVLGKFFGGEGNRGLGAELSVLLPLPWFVELVGSATDAAGESTARSFYGGTDLGVQGLEDLQYTAAAKQFFPLSDNWSLFWGVSAAFGPNPTGMGNRSEVYGTDLYLKYRPITRGSYTIVSLDVEWLLRRRQVPEDVLQDHGLYAYLFWRFARRWAAAARYEVVSGVEADPLDPEWVSARQRASANVTFWPTEFSRLRLQYSYDRPGWRDGYHGFVLAFEFAVGAHGAHKF
jgi:hypothetical protein